MLRLKLGPEADGPPLLGGKASAVVVSQGARHPADVIEGSAALNVSSPKAPLVPMLRQVSDFLVEKIT